MGAEIRKGNYPLSTKYLGKTKGINKEAYARRWGAAEYVGTRNTYYVRTLCEASDFSLEN